MKWGRLALVLAAAVVGGSTGMAWGGVAPPLQTTTSRPPTTFAPPRTVAPAPTVAPPPTAAPPTVAPSTTLPAPADGGSGEGPGWGVVVAAALIGIGVGVGAGFAFGRRRGPGLAWSPPPSAPLPPIPVQPPAPSQEGGREALVKAAMEVSDVVPSDALKGRLAAGLEAAGLTRVDAAGQRLDPTRHHVVGTEPTDDPSRDGVVARTDRAGWMDGSRVVRPPEVVVYRLERR